MIRAGAWVGLAALVPLVFWFLAPEGAEWAGSDDRMAELASPAGRELWRGPEWSASTERYLFWGQAGAGALLLGGSLVAMRRRRGQDECK